MAYIDRSKAPRIGVKWRHTIRLGDAPCGKTEPVHQHSRAMPSEAIATAYANLVTALGDGPPPSAAILLAAHLPMLVEDDVRPAVGALELPTPLRTEEDLRRAAQIITAGRARADWTVYEVCLMHLAAKLDKAKRPSAHTMRFYLKCVANVAGTDFGRMRAADATGEDAAQWMAWLAARPNRIRKGRTLSPTTVRIIRRATVDPAMEWACRRGPRREAPIVDESPMVHVDLPDRAESERDLIRTPQDAAEVLRLAEQVCPAFGELVRLMLFTGLRYSEAISLRCGDLKMVEFDGRRYYFLSVERHWNRTSGVHNGGKTRAARREIPLDAAQYERLYALTVGRQWDALLLEGPSGGLWMPNTYGRRWAKVTRLYNAARPGQRPKNWTGHALRHFYNSVIRNAGVFDPVMVSKVVGHAEKSGAPQVYTHAHLETHAAMAATAVAYVNAGMRV